MEQTGLIYGLVPKVMGSIGAVSKSRTNPQQNYKFRGIDEIYNAVNSALVEHGVFTVPTVLKEVREERQSKSGTAMFYVVLDVAYDVYGPDGSSFRAVVRGEGMDTSDKAGNKALAAAHKYLLLQLFCIPTEEQKDAEQDSHEVKPKAAPAPKAAPKPPEPVPANKEFAKELFGADGKPKIPQGDFPFGELKVREFLEKIPKLSTKESLTTLHNEAAIALGQGDITEAQLAQVDSNIKIRWDAIKTKKQGVTS